MPIVWDIKDLPADFVESAELPYSEFMQKFLRLRGYQSAAQIQKLLFPSLDALYDPFLMKGIERSSKRILSAIAKGETILIHGDYDVDGVTGAALLSRMLEKLNAKFIAFLPNRKIDGYGVSLAAVHLAKEKNVSLFITVDCGITAFEEAKTAREYGIDVIIIDHHRIHEGGVPEAFEIINPLQESCSYPFKELSACGLAFKLAQALLGKGAYEFLDLVALSCVCDVAPLTDENRILIYFGLQRLSKRSQLGIKSLCESAGLKRQKLATSDIGFILGPRINASGRMSSPDNALKLLTTADPKEAGELAQILETENKKRQQTERALTKQAIQKVEREINFNRDRIIVVFDDGWHEGVIGIVAQRLVEHFARPAVVIAVDGEKGKGSGRSIKGFHLFNAFQHCEELLEQFGGHELAAGLSIHRDQLQAFRQKINDYARTLPPEALIKRIRVDLEISFQDLSPRFVKELVLLEPHGPANPKPVFLTRNLSTKRGPEKVSATSVSWWVTNGAMTFEAVWRSRGQAIDFPETQPYTMIYSPKLKSWDGIDSLILEVKDIQ